MELAILAALAMLIQDVIAVVLVQAEAKNKGWTAGLMDMLGWLVAFTTLRIAIKAEGSALVETVILVSIANVLGTKLGQVTGQHFLEKKIRVNPGDPRR